MLTPACRGFNTVDGGLATHFAELAAGLAALGHRVRVVVTDASPMFPDRASDLDGVGFICVPAAMPRWLSRACGWHWPLHTLAGRRIEIQRAARAVRTAHARRPFDCIETDSSGLLALDLLGLPARPPVATRVATTIAQLVAHGGNPPRWHERMLGRWERRLVRGSDCVVTHTEEHRRAVAREFGLPAEGVRLAALGIALPPEADLPPAGSARPPRLLFVGRLENRKGIDVLLDALPGVLAAVPAATCRIIGLDCQGCWERRFRDQNPGVDPSRVEFAGRVDARALQAAYRDCDVFVAPSRYESFGLIYVEAMAWGKPVVGCRAGGIPEVVADGKSGLLAAPGDAADLGAKLIRLLGDPELRARMGAAGRLRVQAEFSRDALARRSADLYLGMEIGRRHAF